MVFNAPLFSPRYSPKPVKNHPDRILTNHWKKNHRFLKKLRIADIIFFFKKWR